MASNFEFLGKYWKDMAQLGALAEGYAQTDPNACIYKLGLLAERVAGEICVFEKIDLPEHTSHADRLRELRSAGLLPGNIDDIFYILRRARNEAVHSGLSTVDRAQMLLRLAHSLCCWFMEVYGDWSFTASEFHTPEAITPELEPELVKPQSNVHTAASAAPRNDRARKAKEAASRLELEGEEEAGEAPVRLEVSVTRVINYALQQNGTPVIKSITVINQTAAPLTDLELTITATPGFAKPLKRHIDQLPAGEVVEFIKPKLTLDPQFLAGTTEKLVGTLEVTLSQGDQILVRDYPETTVLAFDQWSGLGFYPELLTSFVTPNHPEVAKLLARATEFLGQWTGDTSMDAYQSQDPNRVVSQAAAIYTAIKEQGIAYAVPPASFERIGQRVRLCDMVLQQKLGTCLDLTLLYAACLEAAGLHPLLITTPGHIFTGFWVEQRMFPECVQDDASLLTKRLASGVNEIAVVETTCVTSGRDSSFDDARLTAEGQLTGTNPVEYIIDVRRARLSGISPLPQRTHSAEGWRVEHDVTFGADTMSAPKKLEETLVIEPNQQEQTIPKKVQWERKLLDLGMRNTLINLRLTKTQLPILCGSLETLENALAEGGDFSILPRPGDFRLEGLTFEDMQKMGSAQIIQAEFENHRLRSVYTDGELSGVVKGLYRTAKTALEENGANTLYLALGMLRWYESPRSTKPRYAPVILLPIEMVRKSAAQGYVIRLRDDEPQMNITLLEKLKQDFGIRISGVDPLPMDEHGIDIRRVLTIVRKAVMEQPRWDVLEAATIGIFSFSQFVMWNDIRNRTEDLMRNQVVRSLMEGKLCWDAKPLETGSTVPEGDVLLPMSADASQLYAIRTACQGESFVLHGPPGTGKSQTITSLIANALAQGRSVLFVAEKMAALEVVQKRLDNIGIGAFCLELHSNKTRKKDVLEQLRQATEVTKKTTAAEFAAKAEQLAAMRAELDEYAHRLHAPLQCGSDLYTLISEYQTLGEAPELPPFSREFISALDAGKLENLQLLTERLVAAAREVGHPAGHPLSDVGCTRYSQQIRTELPTALEAYLQVLEILRPAAKRLSEALGEPGVSTYAELCRLTEIAENLACWYAFPKTWTKAAFPQQYFGEVRQMANRFLHAGTLEAKLLQTFNPSVLTLPGAALLAEYTEAESKWFLPKAMGMKKLMKKLTPHATAALDKNKLGTYLTDLRDYAAEQAEGKQLLEKYGGDLGSLYLSGDTDWQKIADLAAAAEESAVYLCREYGSHDVLHTHAGSEALREAVTVLSQQRQTFTESKAALYTLLGIYESRREDWLGGQAQLCVNIRTHADELKEWITYVAAATEAREQGLDNVVDYYHAGAAHDTVADACRKALLYGLICHAIDESDALGGFSGAVFNEKIRQYTRADAQWQALSRQEAYCRLAANVPDFTREAAHSSELGILQRFIKSGGRGTSIRKLFDQIPNLLPRLCPCMLMSPISAAQYLDPKREPFDIVVFDEASQLPTCKAVGVLARGRNAVIVGDPKQMPPTAFFATNTVDEDNLDAEDLESILDDCLALNMPQSHLLWHYRSRHESLIAFSNTRFYENKLFTFPSVNDRESKVRLVPVEGVFERGKSRKNRAEAEAVINELIRRCHTPELSGQSVGVVTFNITQQHLIDDLLSEACAKDPALEKWVYEAEEPLFIKNLENVQGDERDVILFSIGYGPDENGKVYMNFGPLNRDGGWRRLNVAVSRARCEMVVFSTLRPEQIDLSRTKAEGVEALRAFLEYAQGRPAALSETALKTQTRKPDGIARAICQALEEKGYETDLRVGRSQYRIDVGVVDPKDPERYLLGILLDGDSYGQARTTRDREIAQTGVLGGLGWNLLRVWSMDWWDNREKEIARILAKLEQLQAGVDVPREELPEEPLDTPKLQSSRGRKKTQREAVVPLYQPAKLQEQILTPEEFMEPRRESGIRKKLQKVVDTESPVSQSVLIRRVLQSYGISRSGSRLQGHMHRILQTMDLKTTTRGEEVFYWKANHDPSSYPGFRLSGEEESRRDIRDIAVQEIANALCTVLREQISMGHEDLIRETAKKLGYTRLGGNVNSSVAAALGYAEYTGLIIPSTNGAYILTPQGKEQAQTVLCWLESPTKP